MASANAEKGGGYSGFERFLFFLTPILFTAVLLFVLMLLFNPGWRQTAMKIGHQIPLVGSVIPAPASPQEQGNTDEQLTVNNAKAKVTELKAQLADRDSALKQADDKAAEQQKTIDSLKSQLDQQNKKLQQQTITSQDYNARIQSLASMYGKMTPGKAAPILESMTVEESSLVLGAMTDTQRGMVLEKMTPKVAADITLKLKDEATVQDREIAALQSHVRELEQKKGGAGSLDSSQIGKTFSKMQPKNAGQLLLQMAGTDQTKALRVISSLDDASRSNILAAMSNIDSKKTAQLVSKLISANH